MRKRSDVVEYDINRRISPYYRLRYIGRRDTPRSTCFEVQEVCKGVLTYYKFYRVTAHYVRPHLKIATFFI